MASEHEQISPDRMAEIIRHARFDIAAGASYTWRLNNNIRLLRRQGAIGVLQESRTHPPLSQTNYQELYRAPLNSESLFGGLLEKTHQQLVQNMQVRPIIVNTGERTRGERKPFKEKIDKTEFKRPYNQAPMKKQKQQRAQKRPYNAPQNTTSPAKRQSPAGASTFTFDSTNNPPPSGVGRNRGKNQGGRGKGKGGNQGFHQ
jgi:hypothetical protein